MISILLPGREDLVEMTSGVAAILAILLTLGACAQAPSPTPLTADLALVDVQVIDVINGVANPGMTVLIADGIITAVKPSADIEVGPGAEVIDGAGRYLIPGLWDKIGRASCRERV